MSPTVVPNPLLDAVISAAVDATASTRGWLLAVAGEQMEVVAGSGDGAWSSVGSRGPVGNGWAGPVIASRRPLALLPEEDDPRFGDDLLLRAGPRPKSILLFPCIHQELVTGAMQLVDKVGEGRFTLDDVELITLLAEVAAAAIVESAGAVAAAAPDPDLLGSQLRDLAFTNPTRYAALAEVVTNLLLRG